MVTETGARVLTILDPAVRPAVREGLLAPRPVDRGREASLDGLRVALLDNVKANAAEFLDRVELRLGERFPAAAFVRQTKRHAGLPCPDPILEALAGCDVVVNAFGD
jgi:hypothetical protein